MGTHHCGNTSLWEHITVGTYHSENTSLWKHITMKNTSLWEHITVLIHHSGDTCLWRHNAVGCSPSSNAFKYLLSNAFLLQVVPSFFVLSSFHLLGSHSVQCLVHLLSFIFAICPAISIFVSVFILLLQNLLLQESLAALSHRWGPIKLCSQS